MHPDPSPPDPWQPGLLARYAGLPPAELAAWRLRLLTCAQEWRSESLRLHALGSQPPVDGPCGQALVAVVERLVGEVRALAGEIERCASELRPGSVT
jgi:hypothetical protein